MEFKTIEIQPPDIITNFVKDFLEFFTGKGEFYIAGGVFASLLQNEPIKDVDVFFVKESEMISAANFFQFDKPNLPITKAMLIPKTDVYPYSVNLVHLKVKNSFELLSNFDWIHSCICYDSVSKKYFAHEAAVELAVCKKLAFNDHQNRTKLTFKSLKRMIKFIKRGYEIDDNNLSILVKELNEDGCDEKWYD